MRTETVVVVTACRIALAIVVSTADRDQSYSYLPAFWDYWRVLSQPSQPRTQVLNVAVPRPSQVASKQAYRTYHQPYRVMTTISPVVSRSLVPTQRLKASVDRRGQAGYYTTGTKGKRSGKYKSSVRGAQRRPRFQRRLSPRSRNRVGPSKVLKTRRSRYQRRDYDRRGSGHLESGKSTSKKSSAVRRQYYGVAKYGSNREEDFDANEMNDEDYVFDDVDEDDEEGDESSDIKAELLRSLSKAKDWGIAEKSAKEKITLYNESGLCQQQGGRCLPLTACDAIENIFDSFCDAAHRQVCCVSRGRECAEQRGFCAESYQLCETAGGLLGQQNQRVAVLSSFWCNGTHRCCRPFDKERRDGRTAALKMSQKPQKLEKKADKISLTEYLARVLSLD